MGTATDADRRERRGQTPEERPRRGAPPEPTRVSAPETPSLPRRLAPRKSPRQERARATVDAILGAAADLFAARGYARTNTNHIARRAGVSVGSLYQYFPNKDAILTALLDRHLRAVEATIARCVLVIEDAAVPLRTGVRHLLEELLELHEADPRLTRAVEDQAGQMPRVPEALGRYEKAYLGKLEQILRSRPEVRSGDHHLMAHLLFEATETASGWLAHGLASRFDRETALDEATLLLCRYVERQPA
jgi:AcrR family transcriptional regulator